MSKKENKNAINLIKNAVLNERVAWRDFVAGCAFLIISLDEDEKARAEMKKAVEACGVKWKTQKRTYNVKFAQAQVLVSSKYKALAPLKTAEEVSEYMTVHKINSASIEALKNIGKDQKKQAEKLKALPCVSVAPEGMETYSKTSIAEAVKDAESKGKPAPMTWMVCAKMLESLTDKEREQIRLYLQGKGVAFSYAVKQTEKKAV